MLLSTIRWDLRITERHCRSRGLKPRSVVWSSRRSLDFLFLSNERILGLDDHFSSFCFCDADGNLNWATRRPRRLITSQPRCLDGSSEAESLCILERKRIWRRLDGFVPGCRVGCWNKKNRVFFPPNHPFVHRVFHYFHHPFWGPTPIFGNTHLYPSTFSETIRHRWCQLADLNIGVKHQGLATKNFQGQIYSPD